MNTSIMKTGIWDIYSEEYPIPNGFVDSTYGGGDVAPSYVSEDGHCIIWMHDANTLIDLYGDEKHRPRFCIQYSPSDEAYGQDRHYLEDLLSVHVYSWDEVIQVIGIFKTHVPI